MEKIFLTITWITACVLVIQDFMYGQVRISWLIGFVVSCVGLSVLKQQCPCLIPFYIFSLVGCFYYVLYKRQGLGSADYFVVFGVSFLLHERDWPLFMMLCGFFGVIGYVLRRDTSIKEFPFIPGILLSAFIVKLIY
ncbi:MAG: hypothetical protein LBF70_02850 [Holosporales bacterium]|jgi:hypothetical protein|nr:hypothetical protein [Holosporales bacterium]